MRQKAASLLGVTGDRRAADHLIKALGDPDTLVKERAIAALGILKDNSAVEPGQDTYGLFRHREYYLQASVISALENIDSEWLNKKYHSINSMEQAELREYRPKSETLRR